MKKKHLALILVAAMVLALLPAVALAEAAEITASGGALSAGKYVLKGDVALHTDLTIDVGEGNTVIIDLHGHVLKGTGSSSVITVASGSLILHDSVSTAKHKGYVDADGLWRLGTGSGTAKTIWGGVISGGWRC